MPVETVLGDVELAVDEPVRMWRLPVERLRPGSAPQERARLLAPVVDGVRGGCGIERVVAHERVALEVARRRKAPRLAEQDVDVRHGTMV
jgi:hypothetical protein